MVFDASRNTKGNERKKKIKKKEENEQLSLISLLPTLLCKADWRAAKRN